MSHASIWRALACKKSGHQVHLICQLRCSEIHRARACSPHNLSCGPIIMDLGKIFIRMISCASWRQYHRHASCLLLHVALKSLKSANTCKCAGNLFTKLSSTHSLIGGTGDQLCNGLIHWIIQNDMPIQREGEGEVSHSFVRSMPRSSTYSIHS